MSQAIINRINIAQTPNKLQIGYRNIAALFIVGVLLVACGGGGGNSAGGTAAITATADTTAQSLTVGTAMASFSPLTPSGGAAPYTYSYTGTLPEGLSFSASTGAVTGTPTAVYVAANLIFSVKDANNVVASTTSTVSFTVGAASVSISATATTTAQSLTVGTAMASFSPLTPSGGAAPYTYSYTGTLPEGLSFSASTGAVTGTPTAVYAAANLIFSVKDANSVVASTTSTVSFTVGAASVSISATATTTAQSLTVGTAMASFSPLTPSGGAAPYAYSYTGTLPAGLSFSTSTGTVTGTPTAVYAAANLIFSVKDANNVVASTTSTVSFTVGAASSSNTVGPTATTYKLSGTLTGLSSGKSVSLSNGTVNLQLNADGIFQMPTVVNDGTKYHVQVSSSDPATQPCTSTSADGEVHSEDVNYIKIYCGISSSGVVSATGALANARSSHTATLLPNGMVLVAGGFDIPGYTISSSELYDPATETWSLTGSLNHARKGHTATLLPNGKVLVAGGFNNNLTYPANGQLSSCELYDPATKTWSVTGALANGRDGHTATLLSNGKVLVTGGYDTNGPLTSSELYDPVLGTWSSTGALANARYFHTATLLPNGRVLVAGGTATYGSNLELSSSELYDPVTKTWSTTGALATARHSYLVALLPNGKVLAAGGYNATGTAMADCELYDPAAGTWSPTGAMSVPRFLGTALLLSSGKVLASGGFGISSNELYDPTTATWTATASLITAREYHTATFLPNGKILITGGYGALALSSSELYW